MNIFNKLCLLEIFLLTFLSGCHDNSTPSDLIIEPIEEAEIITGFCEHWMIQCDYILIEDLDTLNRLIDSFKSNYSHEVTCDIVNPKNLNFEKNILIGLKSSGGGCSASFDRKLITDHSNKKIIYKVKANYDGLCRMLINNSNWALISKPPQHYSIEFILE